MSVRRAVALAAVLLGFLVLPMLMSGTTVALPRIGADLHASGPALQWVAVGYFLAAASMMLVAGSLGDVFGRRRVFAAGAAVSIVGALGSALAGDILVLDAARTVSGIGAAGVMTGGGAMLGSTFTGRARTRVYAAMGTTAGVGMAVGPTLSGWLVGAFGRRATFASFAAAGLLLAAGPAGVIAFLPTYLQDVGGLSVQEAGLIMLMLTCPASASSGRAADQSRCFAPCPGHRQPVADRGRQRLAHCAPPWHRRPGICPGTADNSRPPAESPPSA
ncbi:MFS transporter [Nonomuraea sp. NPDC046802]|uniref:MFS transporter n=1 Tax=Nonomuraea sp. NPDC046802 TaxID=3154919 RepID=UPI0033F5418A